MNNPPGFRIRPSVIFFIITLNAISGVDAQDTLLSIDGQPVLEDEFIFFMKPQRALVSGYFHTHHNAGPSPEFWTKSFSGEIPIDCIREITIRRIIEVRIHLMLARDMGMLDDISFKSFLYRFEKENLRRSEAVEAGEVIYGPKEFSKEAFFSYWYSSLVLSLRKKWGYEYKVLTDSIYSYYQSNQSGFRTADKLILTQVSIPYDDDQGREKALLQAAKIISHTESGLLPCSQSGINCMEVILSSTEFDDMEDPIGEMYRKARILQPGQAVGPVNDTWNRQIILLIAQTKIDGLVQPYNEIEDILIPLYKDLKFKSCIENRISNVDITRQSELLDDILLKNLQ